MVTYKHNKYNEIIAAVQDECEIRVYSMEFIEKQQPDIYQLIDKDEEGLVDVIDVLGNKVIAIYVDKNQLESYGHAALMYVNGDRTYKMFEIWQKTRHPFVVRFPDRGEVVHIFNFGDIIRFPKATYNSYGEEIDHEGNIIEQDVDDDDCEFVPPPTKV